MLSLAKGAAKYRRFTQVNSLSQAECRGFESLRPLWVGVAKWIRALAALHSPSRNVDSKHAPKPASNGNRKPKGPRSQKFTSNHRTATIFLTARNSVATLERGESATAPLSSPARADWLVEKGSSTNSDLRTGVGLPPWACCP